MPANTRSQRNDTDLTSEVGYNPTSTDMRDILSALLSEQRNNLMDMVRTFGVPNTTIRQHISLPKFNAESGEADAVSWCSMVELIFAENPMEGSALISALSGALSGEASQWLTQNCFAGISWPQFKELFLQRFADQETSAAAIMSLFSSQPKLGESIAAYGNRLVSALQTKWKQKSVEEIAVSVALAHMARIDKRLQRLACTTEVTTRAGLQHELKAYSYVEKNTMSVGTPAKVAKLSATFKCHYCGKIGHKYAECHARKEFEKNNKLGKLPSTTLKRKIITCYKCGEEGHISSTCPKKVVPAAMENRIECVSIVEPRGMMQQDGKCFQFFFDSGAECSMVKETIAAKLTGKRLNNIVNLRGIGNATVCCISQILTTVTISDYNLEILLHVVQDNVLNYELLIGREILGMGFEVVTTLHDFKFIKTHVINLCMANTELNLNDLNTDLLDEDKMRLTLLLKNYADSFISGFPNKCVSTGQLKIQLLDNNKTVQRRPYRLSPEEKKTMRNRVDDLIKANIVRPSSSPFASPALLVKKKDGSDRLCVDYREMNKNTVSDKYPLPLISDQIARLRGSNFFTTLDMASGFHQIPIHPESIEK